MTDMGNFGAWVLGREASATALVERTRAGGRREWTFGEVAELTQRLGAALGALDLSAGDVVLTLIGNRPEWVCTLLACWHRGLVALPGNEQLRAKDLRDRLDAAGVAAIVADPRNREQLEAARATCRVVWTDELPAQAGVLGPPAAVAPDSPALMTFTSGTNGPPKCVVHGHRYLWGQEVQARAWMGLQAGDRVWCTAAAGWSKSARNAFVAPWLCGAVVVLHDGRFDPAERLAVVDEERVTVLCQAPTEYRTIVNRGAARPAPSLRSCVAAGEALNAELLRAWEAETGLVIRDGYGQTETGHLTAQPFGAPARAGSMGMPLPGVRAWVDDGELVLDPETLPTFFLGYRGEQAAGDEIWRTGDRVVQDEDGYLYFEGRADDVIISSGYRIGPFEVESALLEHPAVADVGVVPAPDPDRGSIVRAVVVLHEGFAPGPALATALQDHVKATTAPYKYPRRVDFVDELPRTASGKLRRKAIR